MYTHNMFLLIKHLDTCKGFLNCLQKIGLLNQREVQVLYHDMHSKVLDKARRLQ